MTNECATVEKVKKKRGRKPSKNRKGYFYEKEEAAVVDYINSEDEIEKNKIFNTTLKPAFTKMVESIIRRYNFYPPDEEFQDTFDDTISFLMTKLSYFDPNKKYKAYSYCGTICKNYLIYKINQSAKNQKRNVSYDNPNDNLKSNISDNITYSYNENDIKNSFLSDLTSNTVCNIEKIIANKNNLELTKNEIKVGKALINLMKNWDELFAQMGSNKFNKSSIILFIQESTLLTNTEIRESLKLYKKLYYDMKNKLINEK